MLLLAILLPLFVPVPAGLQAQSDEVVQAEQLLAQMSVEERIGQLFVVTFVGDTIRPGDPIVELLLDYDVGGVVLRRTNDNVLGRGDTAIHLTQLTNELQGLALLGASALITETDGSDVVPPTPTPEPDALALPLLVAMQQEGDGPPYDQVLRGLTELPSQMAIGATWNTDHAQAVGEILGRELAALGINMLLGPSLDVLQDPDAGNGLGVRSFGGNPYWVGQMGQAYTAGLHEGSDGRLAVIAKHFPGYGNSDRPLGEEVATVRRTLTEMLQVELAPFMDVTGLAPDAEARVDGLLTTHVRYLGFQSSVQSSAAPVSFDPQAMQTLLSMPAFSEWRQGGGLILSDSLGSRAVQRYYDDTGVEFPHRRVARDALLAGNDLLYLGEFGLEPADDATILANIKDTITWFRERYETDPSFQVRVDDAVRRILQLKLRLYGGDFSPDNVLRDPEAVMEVVQQGRSAVFEVAQGAISLVSAGPGTAQGGLPRVPSPDERIVIFTDVREARQCSSCPPLPYISSTSLEERILALYGPEGTNQVQLNRVRSFTLDELVTFLDEQPQATPTPPADQPQATLIPEEELPDIPETPTPTTAESVDSALLNADWIIFAVLDASPQFPAVQAVRRFLAERPDVIRNRDIVVFAYNSPNILDTTEVSKLSGFYVVYSKIEAFVDASVRALFQESPLSGAPPVDVPSIGYRVGEATEPDPDQIIELFIDQDGTLRAPAGNEPLDVVVGETLRLRTGIIFDRNGNPVPDGTVVQFVQQDRVQGFTSIIAERLTSDGVAELDYLLEARTGQFRIVVVAGEARNSQQVDISIEENARVVVNTPVPTPTETPTSTPTAQPTETPRPTATLTAAATPEPPVGEPGVRITLTDMQMLISVLLGLFLVGGAGTFFARNNGYENLTQLLRLVLWGLVGALLSYNYFALSLPGSGWLETLGGWAGLLTTIVGGAAGLLLAYRLRGAA